MNLDMFQIVEQVHINMYYFLNFTKLNYFSNSRASEKVTVWTREAIVQASQNRRVLNICKKVIRAKYLRVIKLATQNNIGC